MDKICWIVFAVLFAITCRAESPVIVGHGDGETRVTVHLIIYDAERKPLPEVSVTFYDRTQCAMMNARRDEMKALGKTSIPMPTPAEAITGADGSAVLLCKLPAAFLEGVVNGKIEVVKTEIFPAGLFRFQNRAFGTLESASADIFRQLGGSPEEYSAPIALKLSNRPNQPLEPMARSVTPRAGARAAPAPAMAHH